MELESNLFFLLHAVKILLSQAVIVHTPLTPALGDEAGRFGGQPSLHSEF